MPWGGQGVVLGLGEVIAPLLSAVTGSGSHRAVVGQGNQVGGEEVETVNTGQSSKKFGCEWREARVGAGEDTALRG